jgi:hypothetical protein
MFVVSTCLTFLCPLVGLTARATITVDFADDIATWICTDRRVRSWTAVAIAVPLSSHHMDVKFRVDRQAKSIMMSITISQPTHQTTTLRKHLKGPESEPDIRATLPATPPVDETHKILLQSRHIHFISKHIQLKQHPIPLLFRKSAGIQPRHKTLCLWTAQLKIDSATSSFGKGTVEEGGVVARKVAEEDFGDVEGGVVKAGAGEAFGRGEEKGCEG